MIKVKEWSRRNIYYILAFAIPFVVAVTAFICQGMWPFGDRGVSIIDSYHQYVPFFSELQYKWHHGDSLLYSWNGGLGMNFWSVIAYYLASPLNLLLLIFPKSMVMECFAYKRSKSFFVLIDDCLWLLLCIEQLCHWLRLEYYVAGLYRFVPAGHAWDLPSCQRR